MLNALVFRLPLRDIKISRLSVFELEIQHRSRRHPSKRQNKENGRLHHTY